MSGADVVEWETGRDVRCEPEAKGVGRGTREPGMADARKSCRGGN
jgi:hypothetical protein